MFISLSQATNPSTGFISCPSRNLYSTLGYIVQNSDPMPQVIRYNRQLESRLYYSLKKDTYDTMESTRIKEAELVEKTLSESLQEARITHYTQRGSNSFLFPSVRQCNSAIATFGDHGDFRRALKLFTAMRKSVSIIRRMSRSYNALSHVGMNDGSTLEFKKEVQKQRKPSRRSVHLDLIEIPPAPTLVTYSTLISRAVGVGKPRVAIRLWNLMKNQPTFYTNVISRKQRQGRISDPSVFLDPSELRKLEVEEGAIVPDVIFCNTLMNAYAKLGDHLMARFILNSMLGTSKDGNIVLHEIPRLTPTVVSFNTLADACKEAGDLISGLDVLDLMSSYTLLTDDKSIAPDAQTYTILISTVGRKSKDSRIGGDRDPDKAFELLYQMKDRGIKPNGVTYCALIDACGRCQRPDLALSGLRLMLLDKKTENSTKPLVNEVGAWTAAIHACGKYGGIDTALRLFDAMQRQFSVKPNVVTCGSLTDSLVKAGRVSETIKILQYMKNEGIVPGEVMYTSLMSSALEMAQRENHNTIVDGVQVKVIERIVTADNDLSESKNKTNSILLYTELMRSMVRSGRDASNESGDVLMRIFLAFQEMKAAGIDPDLACYNSLLRACSFAGDSEKAKDVLQRMIDDEIEPNSYSYREALRAASKDGRSIVADFVWDQAMSRKKKTYDSGFLPHASDFELLVTAYWNDMQTSTNHTLRTHFHRKIIDAFEGVQSQIPERGLCHISLEEIEQNQLLMLTILRSAMSIALAPKKSNLITEDDIRERAKARCLASDIAALDVLHGDLLPGVDSKTKKALGLAREWVFKD